MKLESLKAPKFEALTKPQMSRITGGDSTGAGGEMTGTYVEGKGWEFRSWTSDERGVYIDPDTGEEAPFFREYGSTTYYVNF